MNNTRRDELAALAIANRLSAAEHAELKQFMTADPVFARELDDLCKLDASMSETGRQTRDHLAATLGPKVRENVLQLMAARARAPWWSLPKVWLGTGLAAAACAALALMFFFQSPALSERGAALLAQTIAKYPTANARLGVMKPDQPGAKACLWLPAAEWSALSPADQAALVAYVKAQVPAIRRDPARYAGVPATDPNFAAISANIGRLRDGEYLIVTLEQNSSGAWVRVPGRVAEG